MGNLKKMEVFNWGENGQDRAVRFQLKMGVQENSFALAIDAKDQERVINLDDSRRIADMSAKDLQTVALLQREGNNLVVSKENSNRKVTQEQLRQTPLIIPLNENTGVELLDFDPRQNSIVIHKVKLQPKVTPQAPSGPETYPLPRPVPPRETPPTSLPWPSEKPPPAPQEINNWRRKLIDIIGPFAIGAPTILAGEEAHNEPPPQPPPIVQEIDQPPQATEQVIPTVEQQPVAPAETQIDQSLRCEKTQEFEIKEGDFLTKALVDVNGIDRYLGPDGKMDVNKLYQDLMCLLAIPENQAALESSDPLVAQFVRDMMSRPMEDLIGPATADRLFEGLQALNSPGGQDRYPGASSQLVVVQPGQEFQIPDFTKLSQPPPPAELPKMGGRP